MTLPGNSAASSGSARDNSAFIGSSSSSPSALPPLPDYPPRAIKRTWTGCNEDGDDEEEDEDNNPFALPPPPKDREAVLHPDILIHLVSNKAGQKQGLKKSLTESQLSLIAKDFDPALHRWDASFTCTERERWKALEASRYATFNPCVGQVDVNVAVNLLVPLIDAED
jgi:hypothetical protein